MDKKEEYFVKKMKLKKDEYEYVGNIPGSGCDFKIKGNKVKRIGRYVEVKGITNKRHVFNLTKNQYNFAKRHKKDYIIYLIERRGFKRTTFKIPFNKLNREPDRYRFDLRLTEIKSFEIV